MANDRSLREMAEISERWNVDRGLRAGNANSKQAGMCVCETASKLPGEGCARVISRESEAESIFCIAWRYSDLPASRRSPGTVTPRYVQCTGGARRRNIAARKTVPRRNERHFRKTVLSRASCSHEFDDAESVRRTVRSYPGRFSR